MTISEATQLIQNSYLRLGTDQKLIQDQEMRECILDAVLKHSKKFPHEMRYDVIGNGEYRYALPSDWDDDFSTIVDIEYPISNRPPSYIDRNLYNVEKVDTTARGVNSALISATSITLTTAANAQYYKDGDLLLISNGTGASLVTQTNWASADGNSTTGALTLKNALSSALTSTPTVAKKNHIRLDADSPLSTDTFIVIYNIAYDITDTVSTTTLVASDERAIMHLAAYLVANSIAAYYGKHFSGNFGADSVDYLQKPSVWAEIGNVQLKLYNEYFGIGEDADVLAGGAWGEMDTTMSTGDEFIYHSGTLR